MDWLKNIFVFIKSPIGSLAVRMIIPLAKMGISWTPTKTDDYYLAKIAYEIIESQCYAKQIIGIPLTEQEQLSLQIAKDNLESAHKRMVDYNLSKNKKNEDAK
jgi:hypothetical protein